MLLQILRTLELLAAGLAFVRLERDVNAEMRGDVVTLHSSYPTATPSTSEVEVVGRLAANMLIAQMFVKLVSLGENSRAGSPLARQLARL